MSMRSRESYQHSGGLEQAVVDLVRVGTSGFGSGVRQLATRLVRNVPPEVQDPDGFRASIHEALAHSVRSAGLRFAEGDLPTEQGTQHRLVDVEPEARADGFVVPVDVRRELDELVEERRRREELERAGVELTRSVLISGPPGVGKTMAARWLAESMGVPLVTLNLASVVSSFLGTSGRNIRAALDYGRSGDCVLLLDEFDALAKRREDDTDIGELKRIVNVVLLELDRWPDSSLLVAATNHAQLLDSAVERRFDRHIAFTPPEVAEREQILAHLAARSSDDVTDQLLRVVAGATEGLTGSDLTRLWHTCKRRSIMRAAPIDEVVLLELVRTEIAAGPRRDALWASIARDLGLSRRQIAELAGVSHPTVSAAIKRAESSS